MSSTQRTGLLLLVVFAVIVGGAWQAAEKPRPVQKWEFKSVSYNHSGDYDKAAELGDDGWELVSATIDATRQSTTLYFKRPKQ